MNNDAVFLSIKKICADYTLRLEKISPANFQLIPPIGGWSYSEVYQHIFDASILSLIPMEECIHGNAVKKPTVFAVKLILFFGMFPPAKRFKVPARLALRVKKIDHEEARMWISKFRLQLDADYPLISSANPHLRTLHPRLGYLNASEWLRVIEIHLKHHLKQLKRIEKSF
jgi:hypothetical protein